MRFGLPAVAVSLAAVSIAASYLVVRHVQPVRTSAERLPAAEAGGVASAQRTGPAETIVQDEASRGGPASMEELATMSETFRHTTLLIAIRDAGFVCDDVAAAHPSGDGIWTVSCGDLGGYAVAVTETGELTADPIPHYFDMVRPEIRFESDERFQRPFDRWRLR